MLYSGLRWLSRLFCFFFSSRRRHTRWNCDWSSDVCSSDLERWPWRAATSRRALARLDRLAPEIEIPRSLVRTRPARRAVRHLMRRHHVRLYDLEEPLLGAAEDVE